MNQMLLIYTPVTTNRINYIFKLMLGNILGIAYRVTNRYDEWLTYEGPRFCYDTEYEGDELFVGQAPLLLNTGTRKIHIEPVMFEGIKAFFPVASARSVFPFDPFAASFYLVSRYEEYSPLLRDVHGRYPATESLAMRYGFLQKPVVNIWAARIGNFLQQRYPDLKIQKRHFNLIPTIDIDSAFAIRNKGFVRVLGGLLKSLYGHDRENVRQRIQVLLGKEKDPFDSFDFQLKIQQKYNFRPIYFILIGDYGSYDKNIPYLNKPFCDIIKHLADYADVGIHPSYASNDEPELLKTEVQRLSGILNREIHGSRQHFLRLEVPATYHNLLRLDIYNDYTMGYASQPGFRASICDPFPFYDLDMEIETPLVIHPFMIMDGTLVDYLRLSPDKGFKYIRQLIDEVKAVEGTFMCLWHNESLGGQGRWAGWPEVYEKMIQYGLGIYLGE
ncbi:MAG: polysaccharide deacetylase family protein [Bacteroidota bacterium]|nr:polysaccharide deacetylase family protein [Bacteroidota bacterium]